MIYPVTDADPSTIVSFLQEQVPDAKLVAISRGPGNILAWATQADHQAIAKILKNLEDGSGQKPQVVVYQIGDGNPKAISLILRSLLPRVTSAVDPRPARSRPPPP